MQSNIIFLDTETTGKGPQDRLIQIAYKFPGQPGLELKFKPPVPISFEAMATHHITEKMLENFTKFDEGNFKLALQAVLATNVMVAHNAIFDKEMLEREGLEVPQYIDTLKVAQHLLDEPSYKLQVLRYKYDFDIEAEAHDALGDVLVLEKLFDFLFVKAMARYPGVMTTNDFVELAIKITGWPVLLRRIGFGKYKGLPFAEIPKDYLQWLAKQPENDEDLKFTLDHYLTPGPAPAAAAAQQQKLV